MSGSVALVTGGSSGIGRAVAERLARSGARVFVAGRDGGRLAAVAAETGATPVVCDLAASGAGRELAEQVLARAGQVDVLVSNAGTGWAGPLAAMPPAKVGELLDVNLRAPIELTRALLPGMCHRRSGHLAYVASIAGRVGVRDEAVYAATKAGLDLFAESVRLETAGQGVAVSVVVPGVVATAFFDRRGRPYLRRRPRPLPAGRVAEALVAAIARGRAEVYVPAWLRAPVAVRAVLPGVYRHLAGRFG